MRLRYKTLLTLAAILTVMTLVLVAIISDMITTNALAEEKNSINDDLTRATAHIYSHNEDLVRSVVDWAVWDDTYYFMQGTNPGYVDTNLPASSMMNLELNFVLFYNMSMELYQSVAYDTINREYISIPDNVLKNVGENISAMVADHAKMASGLVLADHTILLIAFHEISDTDGIAPGVGYMVMARYITPLTMADISEDIKETAMIFPADSPAGSDVGPSAWNDLISSGVIRYALEPGNVISASMPIPGMDGEPAAIIHVEVARDIYDRALASISLLGIVLIAIILAFLVVSLVVTDLFTLRRIVDLSDQVVEIGQRGHYANRVKMEGSDELAGLANEVNRTLDAITNVQKDLLESEKRYRAVVNDQAELIFRMTADGTVTFTNDALLKELGITGTNIVGSKAQQYLPSILMEGLEAQSAEAALSDHPVVRDFKYYHIGEEKDKWYSLSLRSISTEGKMKEFQGVVRDLTEIKEAEQALIEANKKLNLLASISRQNVMNHLTVAHGFVSIALSEIKESRTIEHLKKAEAAINAIQGQLEFTRDYQRTGMVMPVWINLGDSIEKASGHVRSKGIPVNVQVADYDVLADPLAEKVFLNLLDNSDKHGGGVTVIRVSAEQDGSDLVVAFEDNGKGIPAKDKDRIFQVGPGMNASYGLFLAREVFATSGISIKEVGQEGRGARFEIRFPGGRFRHAPKMVKPTSATKE